MKFSNWLMGTAMAAMTLPIAAPSNSFGLIQTAQADIYHSVANGDTLSTIATRYGANIDDLRALNGLRETAATSALPTMLLRVPEAKKGATTHHAISIPALAPQVASVQESAPAGYGTVTKSVVHVVQPHETAESIAARYAQAGYDVTAESVRTKNSLTSQPSVGQRLLIPLQSQTYRSPQPVIKAAAQTQPSGRGSSQSRSNGNAMVSNELFLPGISPTAQEVTIKAPVYQSPNTNANTSRAQAGRRGPTVLASRGYFPSPELDGARVLGRNEDAPVVSNSPRSRMAASNIAGRVQNSPLARVAMVAQRGARIRRLPESSAATLYQCTTGTELAVTQQNGTWSAVLMSDRSTGWVPTRYLRFTGASVDISSQVLTNAAAARSRGTNGLALKGNWNSDHPMVAHALSWLGTRYVYGGTGRNGIDCSALVQTSFRANGIRLPRTAAQQARVGMPVDAQNLQPGDRLYFSASGRRIDHTGLYMGNGLFVHASGSGRGVIVSRLTDSRNWNIFVGARR